MSFSYWLNCNKSPYNGIKLITKYKAKPIAIKTDIQKTVEKKVENIFEKTEKHTINVEYPITNNEAIDLLIKATHVKGTIDIGTGNPVKIRDLAPELPIRLNTPGERQFTCANTKKIKALGWKPKYTVENFLTNEDKGNIINIFNGETVWKISYKT